MLPKVFFDRLSDVRRKKLAVCTPIRVVGIPKIDGFTRPLSVAAAASVHRTPCGTRIRAHFFSCEHHGAPSNVGTPHLVESEIESASFSVFHIHLVDVGIECRVRPLFGSLSPPTAQSSGPSASTTSMARSRRISPSAPARWSESGRMADLRAQARQLPSCMDLDQSPINIHDSHHNFVGPDDATVITTSPEGLPSSGASSSSKHTAASRVPLMFGPSNSRWSHASWWQL